MFFQWVVAHPRTVLALTLGVTLVLGWQATRIELNSSIEALLPDGHPAVLQDRVVKEEFDSREMILVGIVRPDGILHPETLAKIRDLSFAIQSLDLVEPEDSRRFMKAAHEAGPPYDTLVRGITHGGLNSRDRAAVSNLLIDLENNPDAPQALLENAREIHHILDPVSRVISLTEVDDLSSVDGELRVEPLVTDIPRSAADKASLAQRIYANEMYVRGLVASDTTGTAILIEMSFHYDRYIPLAHRLLQRLDSLIDGYRGPEEIRLAGVPMVNVTTSNYMSADMARLMPLVAALVLLVMAGTFRSWSLAILPLALVSVSLVWVLGAMAALGRPITLVVSAMPVILVAVGVADGIHIVSEFREHWARIGDRSAAVLSSMGNLALPVIFTSLTDIAGFGSLGVSSLSSIRDFGLFTSVGVLAALLLSLTALPAALVLLPPPPEPAAKHGRDWLGGALQRVAGLALRRPRWITVGTLVLTALAGVMLTRLPVGSTMVGYFHKDSEIYRASDMINSLFGGTEVLNVIVDTRRPDGLKDPTTLQGIADLQDLLEADSLVGYSSSVADYVKRIHYVLNDQSPAENRLPDVMELADDTVTVAGSDMVAQYLLLYENAGGEDLNQLVDFDYRTANIILQIRTDETPQLRRIKDAAQAFAEARFGPEAQVTFAGCAYLCIVADDLIIPSQIRSLGIAAVVVVVLLGLIFGSVRLGLLGLSPLLVTVLLMFGTMSVFGVHLDAVTALIASIVLGVGIDYSVHFLWRYQRHRGVGLSVDEAVHAVMRTSGRAIVYNSVAVALGFSVLLFSNFWPVIHIGWLVAANMLFGAGLTLLLLPALLKQTARRSREDTGTMDSNETT